MNFALKLRGPLVSALLLLAPAGFGQVAPEAAVETSVISRQPGYFLGWPTLARTADKLMLVYSGGREDHVDPFGRVEWLVSMDEGRTWSEPRTLVDTPIDDRDTSLLVLRNGTIVVGYYASLAYQIHLNAPDRRMARVFGAELPAHLERWRRAETATTVSERERLRGPWMIRSRDGGLTWDAPTKVPCFTPHGPMQLADGTLFYAGADGKKAGVWLSRDEGTTWTWQSDIPVRAGEMHAIQAADGTILVQVRDKVTTTNAAGVALTTNTGTRQTESADGGRTWTPQHDIGVQGYPSHLLRRRDDSLVMTYGYRTKPYGVRARVSRDHGRTWGAERVLTADGATDDLGYPTTVELADGALLTVWYEVPAGSRFAVLRQARWR